jgi:ribosomal protein L29
MSLSKINDIKFLQLEEIENEIIKLRKDLVFLRFEKVTKYKIKTHFFKHYRRKLNQLITLKNQKI